MLFDYPIVIVPPIPDSALMPTVWHLLNNTPASAFTDAFESGLIGPMNDPEVAFAAPWASGSEALTAPELKSAATDSPE